MAIKNTKKSNTKACSSAKACSGSNQNGGAKACSGSSSTKVSDCGCGCDKGGKGDK